MPARSCRTVPIPTARCSSTRRPELSITSRRDAGSRPRLHCAGHGRSRPTACLRTSRKFRSSSPAGRVLASVPGTPEAEDAVLIAQIPDDGHGECGAGRPGSEGVLRWRAAVCADTPARRCCMPPTRLTRLFRWVRSITCAIRECGLFRRLLRDRGQVAQTVPQVIYTIPPSSPVYNVTYVTQVPASAGSVQASYTAGYMGAFIMGATVGAIVCSGTGLLLSALHLSRLLLPLRFHLRLSHL